MFTFIFYQFFNTPISYIVYLLAVSSGLIILFAYDLKHYLLPDKIVFSLIGIVVGYRLFELFQGGELWQLSISIISGIGAGAFFFIIFAASKGRAMGFGDVKLAFLMGLFLSWPNIVVALFIAFFVGAIVGIFLILFKKIKKSQDKSQQKNYYS